MAKKPIIRPDGYYERAYQRQYDAVIKAGHGDNMARWSARRTVEDQRRKDLGTGRVGAGDIDIDCAIAGDASLSPYSPDVGF